MKPHILIKYILLAAILLTVIFAGTGCSPAQTIPMENGYTLQSTPDPNTYTILTAKGNSDLQGYSGQTLFFGPGEVVFRGETYWYSFSGTDQRYSLTIDFPDGTQAEYTHGDALLANGWHYPEQTEASAPTDDVFDSLFSQNIDSIYASPTYEGPFDGDFIRDAILARQAAQSAANNTSAFNVIEIILILVLLIAGILLARLGFVFIRPYFKLFPNSRLRPQSAAWIIRAIGLGLLALGAALLIMRLT